MLNSLAFLCFFWRNHLTGELTDAETEHLYSSKPALTSNFVPGALAYITDNLSTAKGIVNGTPCKLHSLTPHPDEDTERINRDRPPLAEAINAAQPGDMVELLLPPLSVNVELLSQASQYFTLEDSLVPGSFIVPIPLSKYPKTLKLKPSDLLRQRTTPLRNINYFAHAYELGNSCTFHKIQGRTIPRLIIGSYSFVYSDISLYKSNIDSQI